MNASQQKVGSSKGGKKSAEIKIEIQYECVNLTSVVQEFSPIIYYRSQLSFTTMPFSECMLPTWQKIILMKMSHDIWKCYEFE